MQKISTSALLLFNMVQSKFSQYPILKLNSLNSPCALLAWVVEDDEIEIILHFNKDMPNQRSRVLFLTCSTGFTQRLTVTNIFKLMCTFFAVSGQPKDPEEYGKTFNAFIFSLSNSQQTRAFKSMIRNSENATSNHIYLGPTFGNNDIRIDRYPNQPTDYTSSVTNFGNDYFLPSNITIQDPQTILAGVKNFRPDELEVFYLNKGSCRQAKASPP